MYLRGSVTAFKQFPGLHLHVVSGERDLDTTIVKGTILPESTRRCDRLPVLWF